MKTHIIFIHFTIAIFFFSSVLFGSIVFAHGDEEHDALVSQVEVCTALSEGERERCYVSLCESGDVPCLEDVIEAAVSTGGPELALSLLATLNENSSFAVPDTYHLARYIGRVTARDVGMSGETFLRCTSAFQYGCPYGFFEEVLSQVEDVSAEDVSAEHALMKVCDLLSGAERDKCYHRMGHAVMKHTKHNLTGNALMYCDALPDAAVRQHCWDGVFMEAVYWSAAGGTVISWFSADNPLAPCDRADRQHREQCYGNHGSYLLARHGGSLKMALRECAAAGEHSSVCEHSVRNPDHTHQHGMKKGGESTEHHMHMPKKKSWFGRFIGFFVSLFSFGDDEDTMMSDTDSAHTGDSMQPHREEDMQHQDDGHHDTADEDEDSAHTMEPVEPSATIRYKDGKYVPDTVHISVGQKVTWINEDQVFWPAANLHPTHKQYPGSNITKCGTAARDTLFDACEAMGPNAEYSFTFDIVGEWRFHDHINPRAQGTVIVE